MAWPGIALAQLYRRTKIQKYLDGAVWAANFIETTTRDNVNVPPGGYYFGNGQSNKSTEHNIDVFALFTMLAQLTGNSSWLNGALHAQQFVQAMWDAPSGHFWTGTSDAVNIFFNNSPEDVNSWSYLAMQDPNYSVALDWNKTNLLTTDTTFAFNNGWGTFGGLRLRVTGMTFASLSKLGTVLGDGSVDADAVWIEGTGHLIGALLLRKLPPAQDIFSFHGDKNLADCARRKLSGCPEHPRRQPDCQWPAPSGGSRTRRLHQHFEHRFRLQLLPLSTHRSHCLVCHGYAWQKPDADLQVGIDLVGEDHSPLAVFGDLTFRPNYLSLRPFAANRFPCLIRRLALPFANHVCRTHFMFSDRFCELPNTSTANLRGKPLR